MNQDKYVLLYILRIQFDKTELVLLQHSSNSNRIKFRQRGISA